MRKTRPLGRRWPIGKFPMLADATRTIAEASTIIEFLDVQHPGRTPLIPRDAGAAIEARMLDRVFDNYVMTPVQKIVADVLRAADERDEKGVADARDAGEGLCLARPTSGRSITGGTRVRYC